MLTPAVRRRRGRSLPLAVLAVVLGLLLFPVAAGAASNRVDQRQTVVTDVALVAAHFQEATQTFTAGKSGVLYQVDVAVARGASVYPQNCVALILLAVDPATGKPTGAQLGFSTGQCFTDTALHWASLSFDAPSVAGTQYGIEIPPAANTEVSMRWYGSHDPNAYPRGHIYSGIGYQGPGVGATAFRTHVLTKQGCKDGGWREVARFGFKSQGECIKYVKEHGPDGGDGGGDE
jgi:hypothetical protein